MAVDALDPFDALVAGTAALSSLTAALAALVVLVALADCDEDDVPVEPAAVFVAAAPRAVSTPLVPTTLPTASASVTRRAC
jgi:hypothetical protein